MGWNRRETHHGHGSVHELELREAGMRPLLLTTFVLWLHAGQMVAPPSPAAPRATLGAPVPASEPATDGASLGAPVIPPPAHWLTVDLCGALTRAGIDNPTIALAAEAVRASEAVRLRASALLLPSLNAGLNARVHQGTLLSGTGLVRNVNSQSVYFGLGAGAYGSGSVTVPGLRLFAPLAAAYYAPQEAQQQVVARSFDARAVRNHTLFEVADAYLTLVGAHGDLAALRQAAEEVNTIATMTADFAKAGQGRESDAERARSRLLLIVEQQQQAEEQGAVAAAELARLLDLDPSTVLMPAEVVPPLLELVDPAVPLATLLEQALANHPELAARAAEVAAAELRVRQERMRPWLPVLSAGLSVGNFGGAGNEAVPNNWASGARLDYDVYASWSLQNLGAGNRALQNRATAEVGQAAAERLRTVNRIRGDVVAAHALIVARQREIDIARRQIERAHNAFRADLQRTRNLEGRPIEVLRSQEILTTARLALVRAMVGYSTAQLQLYVALGNTPTCTGRLVTLR